MLASDLANTEFVGAQNPDKLLHVEFYMHEPVDPNKSREAGKKVLMPSAPFIRIMKPGDNTSIIETPVREDHKARFPDKWLYFQIQQGQMDGSADIPGWKVETWTFLKPEQINDLKYLRFYTVEQIAGASDAQVQRLGIGGLGMREEARKAIKEQASAGINAELAKKDAEIADMKAAMARMEAAVAALQNPPLREAFMPDAIAGSLQMAPAAKQDTSERDALAAQYFTKFGKKPHHKLGVDKIKAALGE